MGGPARRHLQVSALWGCGPTLGAKEEEQQHDLWEAEPCHEVGVRVITLQFPTKILGRKKVFWRCRRTSPPPSCAVCTFPLNSFLTFMPFGSGSLWTCRAALYCIRPLVQLNRLGSFHIIFHLRTIRCKWEWQMGLNLKRFACKSCLSASLWSMAFPWILWSLRSQTFGG